MTGGPDGEALAETIRAFVHERFQQVKLPRFISSVKVHSFDFGSVAPELELKDVCDPLPDFYDEDNDDSSIGVAPSSAGAFDHPLTNMPPPVRPPPASERSSTQRHVPQRPSLDTAFTTGSFARQHIGTQNPFLSRASTPRIPGGTSNMGYFHLPLSAGLSGAATPLATAVGAQFGGGWPDSFRSSNYENNETSLPDSRRASFTSRPSVSSAGETSLEGEMLETPESRGPEKSVEDVQIVTRFKYSGDVKLSLTADILLDYPMPSFVGIPLKLNVTGMTFDGVAILAYIKNKAHFCFLAPEDADALIGGDVELDMDGDSEGGQAMKKQVGGLFEEIKVESEIGQKTNGKQVLKNVGKVEKFVLEQVRRIFESEFVYPSFWTILH